MFGGQKNIFFKKIEVNNMLCHHNSSRLREVSFQASRRIFVKSDKFLKKIDNESVSGSLTLLLPPIRTGTVGQCCGSGKPFGPRDP
jgi:hypothetical protein